MPFNAGGSTTRTTKTSGGTTWASDAAASNPINATEFDTEAADIYAMLAKCITNDSNQTVAADIAWNAKKITNLADPVSNQDAATKYYVDTNFLVKASPATTGNVTMAAPGSGITLAISSVAAGNSLVLYQSGGGTAFSMGAAGNAVLGAPSSISTTLTIGAIASGNGLIVNQSGGSAALTVNAAGNTTLNAPSSGITLTVNGVSGTHSAKIADSATNLFNVGFLESPINGQGTPYTAVLSDSGKTLYYSATGAAAFTIPANASVAYPTGTILAFVNDATGATNMTIAITSDTLVLSPGGTTGSRTLAQYGRAVAQKVSATRWLISGTGLT